MESKRREFLKNSSLITTALLFNQQLKALTGASGQSSVKNFLHSIPVFHTNDLRGIIDPGTNKKFSGLGGLSNIEGLVKAQGSSPVLVDAGDFLNENHSFEQHKSMIHLMNRIGYHAATFGDRELSLGQDRLANLVPLMNFKLVNCNYEFSNEILRKNVLQYYILKYGRFRVGITGVGIRPTKIHGSENITWHHPYEKANQVATYLKRDQKCDLVICLSHIGFKLRDEVIDNHKFALDSENIDIIISGHDDQVINTLAVLKNKTRDEVFVSNAGWGGLTMGELRFSYDMLGERNEFAFKQYIPGLPFNSSKKEIYRELIA